jgi:hypothetical protein
MKVKVAYTVDADDSLRRAINAWYGRPGMATREQVQSWYEANGHSMDHDLADVGDGLRPDTEVIREIRFVSRRRGGGKEFAGRTAAT